MKIKNLWPYIPAVTAAFLGCAGGKAADKPEVAATFEPTAVVIYNGAGRYDICAALAAKRSWEPESTVKPYRVPAADYADGKIFYGVKETYARCKEDDRPAVETLLNELGCGKVEVEPNAKEIEVIIGWDAAASKPPTDAPAGGVLINKTEKAVYYYESGTLTHVWPCAIGKPESPTPAGNFEVTVTLEDPTWYWQGKAIPPGPDNGLGKWFIGINKKGYGVHGTNEPASIGGAASHGCVRMYNDDAGELVKLVKPGTPVIITE